ncbi:HNH endonuclease [Nesterenkonia xinjiangensis]|uniref:Putative restriction endonuclease n=1 Tax=Nesterenkonia xinjiangensis TaxID=225327 RepID=A0A7Z0K9P6_9MICC|nr:HNH endonuclease [Nesterenkonia xinjiangensis]NYJ78921.1 putative restriction endonuclease [Nesterenkonia xinjiangensis]
MTLPIPDGSALSTGLAQDLDFRRLAFGWLEQRTEGGAKPLSRGEIQEFKGHRPEARHHLILQEGIWKPAELLGTLSVTTGLPHGRKDRTIYHDEMSGGLVDYQFTASPKKQHQNKGLVQAAELNLPVIYFRGTVSGAFDVYFPVYVQIPPGRRTALLDLTSRSLPTGLVDFGYSGSLIEVDPEHGERTVRSRLHQRDFRANVMTAYQKHCAVCTLGHSKLLDAAHIVEDSQGGRPEISNGLALCKIHHAAYDSNIMGISPDHRIHIRRDILEETDGPMLRHGLQDHEGQQLRVLPANRTWHPDREALAERFDTFKTATPLG